MDDFCKTVMDVVPSLFSGHAGAYIIIFFLGIAVNVTVARIFSAAGHLADRFELKEEREAIAALGKSAGFFAMFLLWQYFYIHSSVSIDPLAVKVLKGAVWISLLFFIVRLVTPVSIFLQVRMKLAGKGLVERVVPFSDRIVKFIIILTGLLLIMDNLGITITTIVAGLGIGGVVLALTLQSTVNNFFGTYAIAFDGIYKMKNRVVAARKDGFVMDMGFHSTKILTFEDSLVAVPNYIIIERPLNNLSARGKKRARGIFCVSYDTPREKIEAFIEEIREVVRHSELSDKENIHVYMHNFGLYSFEILVWFYLFSKGRGAEYFERERMMIAILQKAHDMGIMIALPATTGHEVKKGM